jgi:hypothetical protein
MIDETLQALVDTVARALTAAGYVSEPDHANNTSNAPAYLKVFCKDIPKRRRVDYLNLVFNGTSCERVTIEGEKAIYVIPNDLKALVDRVQYNLPCASVSG